MPWWNPIDDIKAAGSALQSLDQNITKGVYNLVTGNAYDNAQAGISSFDPQRDAALNGGTAAPYAQQAAKFNYTYMNEGAGHKIFDDSQAIDPWTGKTVTQNDPEWGKVWAYYNGLNQYGSSGAGSNPQISQTQQAVNNFLTTNPVGQAIAPVLANGASVSTGFGSGTPTGTTVHQGTGAPTPTTPSDQQINSQINNAANTYHQNNPSVTTPTNPVKTIPNPQAYAPGYNPVGQVNSTNYNGAQPLSPKNSGSSTSADASTPNSSTTTPANNTGTKSSDASWQQWIAPAAAVAQGAAAITAGNQTAAADKQAADAQQAAAQAAIEEQKREFDQIQANSKPWRDAGQTALGDANTPGTLTYLTLHPNQFNFQQDPGYQFRLSQGLEGLQNSAAARGQLLSGNTLKGLNDYAQGSASQEYNDAFNRYMAKNGQQLNALQSLAGVGQTAVQQVNNAGQNAANNISQETIGAGNALAQGYTGAANAGAAGIIGAGNALASGANNYYNNYTSNNLINKLGQYGY